MSGKDLRLNKLFSKGENAVIIAMDHGYQNGIAPAMEDLTKTIQNVDSGADGVLMSPGTLRNFYKNLAYKGAPMPVVRLTWSPFFYGGTWTSEHAKSVNAFDVEDAVKFGAEIVLVSLTLHTGDEYEDAENVRLFGNLSRKAREYGIPVIGEYIPFNLENVSDEELHDQVLRGCRIISELGADLIKTFYTYKFDEVIKNCSIPVLGLGGDKKDKDIDALILAKDIINAGAKGVVFGRNSLQCKKPKPFQKALQEVVKKGVDPVMAVQKYELD